MPRHVIQKRSSEKPTFRDGIQLGFCISASCPRILWCAGQSFPELGRKVVRVLAAKEGFTAPPGRLGASEAIDGIAQTRARLESQLSRQVARQVEIGFTAPIEGQLEMSELTKAQRAFERVVVGKASQSVAKQALGLVQVALSLSLEDREGA